MERARTEGDPVRIARAVLGIGGGGFWGWWDEFGVADLDLLAYLERAARGARRRRLRAPVRAPRPARRRGVLHDVAGATARFSAEALAMARRLDDPVALTVALASELLVSWTHENLEQRLELDDELVAIAAGNSIAYGELIGRHFRMVDRLESGDRAAADADLAACEHLAERLGHYAFHVQLAWYRSMIAFVEGRLEDAERLTHDAFERNLLSNEPAAWTAYGVQMFRLRREQGRHVELEGVIRASAERQPHLAMALNTGLATIAGEHGRTDEARGLLDQVVADGPFANDDDLMATLHAMHIAEAAVAIEHVEAANAIAAMLDAHTGRIGVLATGHLCFGAIDRARAAMSLGR